MQSPGAQAITLTRARHSTSRRSTARKRRGGRPSRGDALQLTDRILESAGELFLEHGYGATSIEAIARRAGISKRTFYHRFADKPVLLAAVVHRIIERIRPPPDVALLEGKTLHEILRRLAGFILQAALSAPAIALHRLITAESGRFPELASAIDTEGTSSQAVALISGVLERELGNPAMDAKARQFAARQFLQLVLTVPQRRALGLQQAMTRAELEEWADSSVRLFLQGCRGWERR